MDPVHRNGDWRTIGDYWATSVPLLCGEWGADGSQLRLHWNRYVPAQWLWTNADSVGHSYANGHGYSYIDGDTYSYIHSDTDLDWNTIAFANMRATDPVIRRYHDVAWSWLGPDQPQHGGGVN